MRLLRYQHHEGASGAATGVLMGQEVVPLAALGDFPQDTASILAGGAALREALMAAAAACATRLPLAGLKLLMPVERPGKVICIGLNYALHAKEGNNPIPDYPAVFLRVQSSLIGPDAPMLRPGCSTKLDYEAELAVIIGQGGKNISQADAMKHVFGYTVVNDVTARDVQMRHQQWDMGKSFDTFCPMGPWIVTADEIDGRNTRVRCWVNGELRQDGPTENMIFDIPTLIETISRGITLYPGDIIATGTPAGVGMGLNPPRYIAKGDVIRVEIDGVGHIENRFV